MKVLTEMTFAVIVAVAAAVTGTVFTGAQKAAAQADTNQAQAQTPAQPEAPKPETAADATYDYVAQPGDSYSLMARKAVQTYGAKYQVTLNLAQIMYAETMLTQEAGSPPLNEGQQISLKESSLKPWIEKAKALSAEDQAAWDQYAQLANFDTNHVGQSS